MQKEENRGICYPTPSLRLSKTERGKKSEPAEEGEQKAGKQQQTKNINLTAKRNKNETKNLGKQQNVKTHVQTRENKQQDQHNNV